MQCGDYCGAVVDHVAAPPPRGRHGPVDHLNGGVRVGAAGVELAAGGVDSLVLVQSGEDAIAADLQHTWSRSLEESFKTLSSSSLTSSCSRGRKDSGIGEAGVEFCFLPHFFQGDDALASWSLDSSGGNGHLPLWLGMPPPMLCIEKGEGEREMDRITVQH